MKSIYEYKHYRLYLNDFYLTKKAVSSDYSYAHFAKSAGISSPNYLKLVSSGKRDLTINNIHQFSIALELTHRETEFFEALVLENQARSGVTKKFYTRRISVLRKTDASNNQKAFSRRKNFHILDNTLKLCSLILCSRQTLEKAEAILKEELSLSQSEANIIIKDLIASGDLVTDGIYLTLPQKNQMVHDPKGKNHKQFQFLLDGLKEAGEQFKERYPLKPGKFFSILYTAKTGSLESMFDRMRCGAEAGIRDHEPLDGDDVGVYRFQFQLYRIKKYLE